eukprot:TRINITY_DN912_c0_g1_i9.p1 TRINITY_DN912_c0_g1~~TRINITY_DN912_c0_g1_i9.p1  ORF type:complete len:110 (+),score=29.93 TRINITY_DN912_c0_g1_i9:129-458(+)
MKDDKRLEFEEGRFLLSNLHEKDLSFAEIKSDFSFTLVLSENREKKLTLSFTKGDNFFERVQSLCFDSELPNDLTEQDLLIFFAKTLRDASSLEAVSYTHLTLPTIYSV